MLARVLVAAILFMTVAHQIACQTAPVTSTTTLNATQGIDSNSTFTVAASAGGLPQAVYYQVSWNVSDATSVNITFHIYVNGTLKKTAQNNNHLSETPIRSTFSVSGLLDPCAGSVSENDAVEVNFVVNTDGISGDATLTTGTVEIPSIQNGTTFDFKCGVETALGLPCVFYYTTEVNVTEGETFYLMGKANGSVAYVALEENGVCPGDNFQTLGATDTTLTGVANNTKLWIAVNATSSLAMPQLTFTWLSVEVPPIPPNASPETPVGSTPIAPETPETPNTPEQSPVTEVPAVVNGTTPESGPVSTPNGDENNNLPQWALALLIVFGLLIGVLLIVVIVLCVKNRRRAQYNTV